MTTVRNLMGTGSSGPAAQAAVGLPAVGLTALGNSQGTAYALTSDLNVFTTVASSTGCLLPTSAIGDWITVVNHGANTLSVYPPSGGKIANGSTNAAFSVAATKTAQFQCISGDGLQYAASLSA
jgi:hypothetical protein